MSLTVAIVGSGPAGCYAAEQLARGAPDATIDVIDRLPTPYGLVRAGVAPDHQGTKSVERVLERALTRPNVAFFGNVEIGRDLGLAELRRLYDAVILATGAPEDRRLGIPGEDLAGVFGSGVFTRWINGHPDAAELPVRLEGVRSVVVIGNGNVAIDVARVLAKSREEMARSDLAPFIEAAIAAAPLEEIHIVGRRGPAEAHFTAVELDELGSLARAMPVVKPTDLPPAADADNAAVLEIFHRFAAAPTAAKPIRIHFDFRLRPLRLEGSGKVERAIFERQRRRGDSHEPTGETAILRADLVVACIGYRSIPCGDLGPENGVFRNDGGRIEPGLYVVGWAKRGPSGTIPTNRAEAHGVADRLLSEMSAGDKPGRAGLAAALAARGTKAVDFGEWRAINAAERARAGEGRPREKLRRWEEFGTVRR
ncbi:MAG: FAD-dependent oxidoreductase [Acidobacteriota bacterium]